MSKTEQALILEPSTELTFKGPFTDIVTAYLKLQNPTEKKICFKVKTTAPKRYCVRPNGGILDPGSSISVAVMLQPFEYDPSEKSKHKFMVQSMFAPDGKIESQEQLWKDASPDSLMDTKLKCVFDMPDGTAQNGVQDVSQEEKVKPVKTEPASVTPSKPSAPGAGEEKKLMEEARRLQSEVNVLTAENRKLKEEGARLRKVAMADTLASTPPSSQQSSFIVEKPAVSTVPLVLYVLAAVIVGLLIGKFIL
ncbi:vesicle-associated membrane protein/synaptobrevin-binding protein-like [Babylonia areolata]|uniref:vesicle-associated membrane protein/synaptobrevin-binding protein-like n=1 Tax=Babylonia areolata TaxID=304850 RepID=UPI003FD50BED